jgi:YHS domain-containing protein
MQKILFAACSAFFVTAVGVWGCSKASNKTVSTATPPATESQAKDASSGGTASAEITAALAKLPAEDRTLAEKQKVCPVSGEALGTMGAPPKMEVKGQTVFLCCEGCKDKLLANPDEYLAKLNK